MFLLLMPTCPNVAGADQSPELPLSYLDDEANEAVSEPVTDSAWCAVEVGCWCQRCAPLGEHRQPRT